MGGAAGACLCGVGGAAGAYWLLQADSPSAPLAATSVANRRALLKQVDKPAIVPRATWGALPPNHAAENENGFFSDENPEGWRVYEPDIRATYKTLVVHHSVMDEGDDASTLQEIQRLHRQDRAWADVAYHFFIGKDGAVYEGRALDVRGTHVAGYNTGSIGVCLLGNFMETTPTAEQFSALRALGKWLALRLQLTHLAGHRDFNSITVCPGENLAPKLPELALFVGLAYGTEGYTGPLPASSSEESRGCGCHV